MKKFLYILLAGLALVLVSCSSLIGDLTNLKENKGTRYTVEHYTRTLESLNKEWGLLTSEEQDEFRDVARELITLEIDDDNYGSELEKLAQHCYEWKLMESLTDIRKGVPGELTNGTFKVIPGFTPDTVKNNSDPEDIDPDTNQPRIIVRQVDIEEDGSTVVKVYYARLKTKVTFTLGTGTTDAGEVYGLWNYAADRKTPVEDLEPAAYAPVVLTNWYGSDATVDLSTVGMKQHRLTGWKTADGKNEMTKEEMADAVSNKTITHGITDVEWIAQWEVVDGVIYYVRNHYQNVALNNYDQDDAKNSDGSGKAGEMTAYVAPEKTGFHLKEEIVQKTIEADEDNPTYLDAYYDRNLYTVTYDLNDADAMWNFKLYRDDNTVTPDTDSKVSADVPFEAPFPKPDFTNMGKAGHKFTGWTVNGTGDAVALDALPETVLAEDMTLTANWLKLNKANYTVRHLLRTAVSYRKSWEELTAAEKNGFKNDPDAYNYKVNDDLTRSDFSGDPDTKTEAVALTETELPGYVLDEAKHAGGVIVQKFIESDGSTVIDIYYARKEYTVTFNTDGGAWDYADNKDSTDTVSKEVKAILDATAAVPSDVKLGKKSYNFMGWSTDGGKTVLSAEEISALPVTGDLTYTAVWQEKTGVDVTVKHYKRTARSYVKAWAVMTEEEKASSGAANELEYTYDVENQTVPNCKPDTLTEVEAKNFTGMSLETAKNTEVHQEMVNDDGSTVVSIYYQRNSYTATFALDGGAWNYTAYIADEEHVTPDTENKTVTQVYGLPVTNPSFKTIGKKTFKADGWMAQSGEEIPVAVATADLPATMGPADVTYTAKWVENTGIAYTVRHHYQNAARTLYDHEIAADENLTGRAETVPEINKKVLDGFEFAGGITGNIPEIAADGSTVIDIYYNRLMFNVTYQINGGYWDYKTNKDSASDQADKVIDAAFGAAIATPDTASMGYKGHRLTGWSKDNGKTIVQFEDLVKLTQPAQNVVYKAIWAEASGIPYTVKHYRKTVDAYVKAWANLTEQEKAATGKTEESYTYDIQTETLFGNADDPTAATLKNYGVGFELAKEGNALDGTTPVINQGVINDDESTVVNIYYDRITFSTTYKLDGGTWDYTIKGASGDSADVEKRTIFEREISKPSFLDVGKTSKKLKGWTEDGGKTVITTAALPATQAAENKTFTAVWEDNTVNYTVETYLQNIDDNEFTLESSETQSGIAETTTAVVAPAVTGFTASPIIQKEIDKNGTTVVQIQYVRNTYTIEYDINEGVWNWSKVQTGEIADTSVKQYKTVKYGAALPKPALNDIYRLKYVFEGWTADGGKTIVSSAELPETVGAANVTYVAKWTARGDLNYTVKHLFEKVDDTTYEANASYADDTLKGGEGDLTTATSVVKTVTGFEAQPVTEAKITVEGTVVEVKYNRAVHKVTFDLNGGAWNYTEYKADKEHVTPDTEAEVITGKYGSPVVAPSFTSVGKSHSNLTGWYKDGDSKRKIDPAGPFVTTIQEADVVYQAQWVYDGGTQYIVKHAFENTAGAYVVDESKNVTNVGDEGEMTEAVVLSADQTLGFTPQAIEQVRIPAIGVPLTVTVNYDRNTYDFTFDGNGGSWSGAATKTVSAKFGKTVAAGSIPAAPARANWTFGGWRADGEETVLTNEQVAAVEMPIDGKTFTAYWVGTTTIAEPTVPGDVTLTATPVSGGIAVTVTPPSDTDPSRWTYTWYVEGIEKSLKTASGTISTTPGKRTVTVIALYKRPDGSTDPARTKQATVTVSN